MLLQARAWRCLRQLVMARRRTLGLALLSTLGLVLYTNNSNVIKLNDQFQSAKISVLRRQTKSVNDAADSNNTSIIEEKRPLVAEVFTGDKVSSPAPVVVVPPLDRIMNDVKELEDAELRLLAQRLNKIFEERSIVR